MKAKIPHPKESSKRGQKATEPIGRSRGGRPSSLERVNASLSALGPVRTTLDLALFAAYHRVWKRQGVARSMRQAEMVEAIGALLGPQSPKRSKLKGFLLALEKAGLAPREGANLVAPDYMVEPNYKQFFGQLEVFLKNMKVTTNVSGVLRVRGQTAEAAAVDFELPPMWFFPWSYLDSIALRYYRVNLLDENSLRRDMSPVQARAPLYAFCHLVLERPEVVEEPTRLASLLWGLLRGALLGEGPTNIEECAESAIAALCDLTGTLQGPLAWKAGGMHTSQVSFSKAYGALHQGIRHVIWRRTRRLSNDESRRRGKETSRDEFWVDKTVYCFPCARPQCALIGPGYQGPDKLLRDAIFSM